MSWNDFVNELLTGWPDATQVERILLRLTAAAVLGAFVGYERESAGKAAGVRTHMLVALATTLFIVASLEFGMSAADISRVVQGLAAGIGFLGAGAILKLADEREITGLTTAAGIWMTAAVGVAVGLGRWGTAVISVALTLVILRIVGRFTSATKD
jgi:putative Mg2+ transporter-C (MgtC) family protein